MTDDGRGPQGGRAAALAAVIVAWALLATNAGLLTGHETPCYRDIGHTQRPARALAAQLGSAALMPQASFGQIYSGNPNFVLGYPMPKDPRFLGRHLLLHVFLGLLGAFLYFRRLVKSAEAALFGALAWGLSGFVLSSLAFLNATSVLAWTPFLLLFARSAREARGPRAITVAATGLVASIALVVLGGEPMMSLLVLAMGFGLAVSGEAIGHGLEKSERLRRARAGALAFLASGLGAALLLLPWLLEVYRSTESSSRRLRPFSFAEFAGVGFNPVRFVESFFPYVWGDPTRILSGGYWGFFVTQGNTPYWACLTFGVLPLVLAAVFALSARRVEGRYFLVLGFLGVLVGLAPWIPGASRVYDALPFLHALRFPGKAVVWTAFAIAALSALAIDRLVLGGSLSRFRGRVFTALLALAFLLGGAAVAFRVAPTLPERLLLSLWDPAFAADPRVVLAPVISRLSLQAAFAAAQLLLLAVLMKSGRAGFRGRLLLLLTLAADLLLAGRRHVPRVPAETFDEVSPLVAAARQLEGRVFERIGKDLDAVRRGVSGRYPEDDARALARAAVRQGWALTGAPLGLSYAYDEDPDGSYTALTRLGRDIVTFLPWDRRVRWLRAAGVTGVLSSEDLSGVPGLAPVLSDATIGVPVTLHRIESPLPPVRRLSRVHPSASVNEAVNRFFEPGFDPRTDGIVAGKVPPGLEASPAGEPDAAATARLVKELPDLVEAQTSGAMPGVLLVARSYTSAVKAEVNGTPARVQAISVHLIGVAVPAGPARVVVDLAPR
ncbi:MAG: hypothetical protein JNK60_05440 [Acidobacteria bacterium]|nr:hypothetical protein [Acidobacteriota bacterium]